MKLYTDFALKYRPLRDNMQIEWSKFEREVNDNVFGDYLFLSKVSIPGYTINLGKFSCPSKLFFNIEPLWEKDMENKQINIITLMNQIKTSLEKKLKGLYGNAVPSISSGHFLLHMIVADVLESKYSNEEIMTEQMIMDCIICIGRTVGRKGNIYAEWVFSSVVLTIEDFLKFRQITKNMIQLDDDMLSRSYHYKIRTELIASGMKYNEETNEILFESSKLKIPHIIHPENSEINFNHLKKCVQELYIIFKKKFK